MKANEGGEPYIAVVGAGFQIGGSMAEKTLVTIKVDDLIPYENNPRIIPTRAVEDVRESYRQCGYIDPIEVDENNVILSGHTRRLAAIEEGIEELDCLRITGLTEEQKRKYRLLANKTGEKSEWDFELLDIEVAEVDFEGYDFGFESTDIDWAKVDDLSEENFEESTVKKIRCPNCNYVGPKAMFVSAGEE